MRFCGFSRRSFEKHEQIHVLCALLLEKMMLLLPESRSSPKAVLAGMGEQPDKFMKSQYFPQNPLEIVIAS